MQGRDTRFGTVLENDEACRSETVPWLPILMYHRVVPRVEGPDPHNLKVSTSDFDAQMKYLKDRGYQSVYLDELGTAAGNGFSFWTKPVIITFDDGYRDTFTNALPILKKYQLGATVLLVSARIGGSNLWDLGRAEASPLVGLDEIREMAKHGIRFGAHSATHRPLTELNTEEAYREIAGSKAALEDMLGCDVGVFSFPHGRSTPEHSQMARQAGYVAACGIEQRHHSLFNLSRVDAASCRGSRLLWRLKVSGVYHQARQRGSLRTLKAIARRVAP